MERYGPFGYEKSEPKIQEIRLPQRATKTPQTDNKGETHKQGDSPQPQRVRRWPFRLDCREMIPCPPEDETTIKALPGIFGGWPLGNAQYVILKTWLIENKCLADDLRDLEWRDMMVIVRQLNRVILRSFYRHLRTSGHVGRSTFLEGLPINGFLDGLPGVSDSSARLVPIPRPATEPDRSLSVRGPGEPPSNTAINGEEGTMTHIEPATIAPATEELVPAHHQVQETADGTYQVSRSDLGLGHYATLVLDLILDIDRRGVRLNRKRHGKAGRSQLTQWLRRKADKLNRREYALIGTAINKVKGVNGVLVLDIPDKKIRLVN